MENIFGAMMSITYGLTEAMANGLWIGLVITGLVLLGWKLSRTPEGAAGYTLWWSALILILPGLVGPAQLPIETTPTSSVTTIQSAATQANYAPNQEAARPPKNPAKPSQFSATSIGTSSPGAHHLTSPTIVSEKIEANPVLPTPSALALIVQVLPALAILIWMAISSILIIRLTRSALKVRQIKRQAKILNLRHWPSVETLLGEVNPSRKIPSFLSM